MAGYDAALTGEEKRLRAEKFPGLKQVQIVAMAVEACTTEEHARREFFILGSAWRAGRAAVRDPETREKMERGEVTIGGAQRMTREPDHLRAHPAAEIFPLVSGGDKDELRASLEKHGFRDDHEPIVRHHDGRIIDGRNRARICHELGIECPSKAYEGDDDTILDFVISKNLARRQLSESQRGMVAAKMANLTRGGAGNKANAPIGAFSQEDAAKALNVSRRSVQRAATVLKSGDKKLIEKVEKGEIKLDQAARSLGPAPRKKPTREGLNVAEGAKPKKPPQERTQDVTAVAPKPRKEPSPYDDLALQFSNLINRIEEIAQRVDPYEFRSIFPADYVKNLDISLEKARDFLIAMWDAHAAKEKDAAGMPATPRNLH